MWLEIGSDIARLYAGGILRRRELLPPAAHGKLLAVCYGKKRIYGLRHL
jgi:hypothetical protein